MRNELAPFLREFRDIQFKKNNILLLNNCYTLFLLFRNQKTGTYGRPLLCQPHGAVKGVAGLQDGRLWGVQTLPFIGGCDDTLHVLLYAGHGASLDTAAAGGGAGCPWAALPPEIKNKKGW